LPAGTQPGVATAVDHDDSEERDLLVQSIVNRCLGNSEPGAAASRNVQIETMV